MAHKMQMRQSANAVAREARPHARSVPTTIRRCMAPSALPRGVAAFSAPAARSSAPSRVVVQAQATYSTVGSAGSVNASEAAQMMTQGWTMLDVRPPYESEKVGVKGAVVVPMYVPDNGTDLGTLIKQAAYMGMVGWLAGGCHLKPNDNFLPEVQAKIPKDAKVIVGCQDGLRALAAAAALKRVGYTEVVTLSGGFDEARTTIPSVDGRDLRYAGIGGFEEAVGWTKVQQENKEEKLGGRFGPIKVAGVVLAGDMLWSLWTSYETYQATGQMSFFGIPL